MNPLVHIPVPIYNAAPFLAETLDSYLNQTYTLWHAFLVDDCSTDNSLSIAHAYSQRYPHHFTLISNSTNLGLTKNCNKALSFCTSPLIAFGSGDDLMHADKLLDQVKEFSKSPDLILCYHDVQVLDNDSGSILRGWNSTKSTNYPYAGIGTFVASMLVKYGTAFMASQSVMVSSESLKGLKFDSRIPYASDWLLWIDICMSS